MKKLSFIGLLLILILGLCSCGGGNNESQDSSGGNGEADKTATSESKAEAEKSLNLGETADYNFGTFTISGFKRDGQTLYFSIVINPKNSGSNTVNLDEFYYDVGSTENKINNLSVQLAGSPFQNLYTVTSDKVGEINAMSLDYEGVKAKWNLDLNASSGGDINYIDTTIAQIKAEQERKNQEEAARKAAQEEKNNVAYAWQVVDQYGEQLYPYGFKLHYIMDKLAEEKQSDGTWFLKAGCDVTNAYNAKMSGVCEAVVQGSGQNWTVLSFNVY